LFFRTRNKFGFSNWNATLSRREEGLIAMTDIHFISVDFQITEEDAFAEALSDVDPGGSREEAILDRMIASPVPPVDAGFEIVESRLEEIVRGERPSLRITVEARVFDGEALRRAASEAWGDCWGDRDWRPESDGEALLEILFHSNDNPCPSMMGFEFTECDAEARPVVSADQGDLTP
jgi:hypothetical protein